MPHVLIERFVGTFPAWTRLFPWCHPCIRAGFWGLHPAGCTSPARVRVGERPSTNPSSSQELCQAQAGVHQATKHPQSRSLPAPAAPDPVLLTPKGWVCAPGAARLRSPARLHSPSISQALCLLLSSSLFLVALFSFPKTSAQGKAGQEQKQKRSASANAVGIGAPFVRF